jgi:tetratricopeptide (TPR) repeat protein
MKKIFALVLLILALSFTFNAQTPIELAQGAKGITPADYYELSQEAERFYQQQNYAKAADAYAKLTAAYPLNGENWYWLGRALYQNGKFKEAANSFVKADELGTSFQGRNNAAFAALAFAQANEPNPALDWLERTVVTYHNAEATNFLLQQNGFAGLRQNPRFQKLATPTVSATASRTEGWGTDLDYLLTEIRCFNTEYNQPQMKEKVESAGASLRKQIPSLDDVQIAIEMHKIVALLNTSHTEVFLHRQPQKFKFAEPLPVNMWVFPDGIYVVGADDEFKSLIASRVTAIDGNPIEQVVEKLRPLIGFEGEPTRGITTRFLVLPHVLHGLRLAKKSDRLNLSVVDRDNKARTVDISSKPMHQWSNGLPPSPIANANAPIPLYQTNPNDLYWFEHLPKEKAVYVRINAMRNKPDETIAAFGLRLRQFFYKQTETQNLIVDLRGNGGNGYLYPELLRTIIGFDAKQGNRVFALIDRGVGSAATNFTVDLDRLTNAVFVGEPMGGQPRQTGDPRFFNLPYSGVQVMLSAVVWNLSGPRETRRWLSPDIPVALTSTDYFANRDPVMETVIGLINKNAKTESLNSIVSPAR